MMTRPHFPASFQHYRPRWQKVFGIICYTDDKKYLLVLGRKANKWSFPKGHMEGSECALDCALRELMEEAGVDLRGHVHRGTIKLSKTRDGKNSEYFVFGVGKEIPVRVQDTNEIIDAGWFTVEEMRRMHCNMDVSSFHSRGDHF